MSTETLGPLHGIRVLDLGTMIAGPVAATLLGDFGADVIKVEQPQGGDPIRQNGAQFEGEGLWWNVEGRNKRSVTLDLRVSEGQDILRKMAAHADVLVENFRPGTMARWGLDYERLRTVNPKLIMLSISGYGQTGPYAPRAAYDRIGLAFSGLLHVTGQDDGPPLRPGTAIADYQSALMGAFAVMIALYHRDARSGVGQHVDTSLYESVFRFTDIMVTAFDKLGVARKRQGNAHFAAAPGDHFETSDGRYLVLTVSSNSVFQRLCEAMQRPDLVQDPRFATHIQRWDNIREINSIVAEWIKSAPVATIMELLEKHGLAFSLVYSAAEIVEDPQYAARGSIATVNHPRIGRLIMPAPHPKLGGTPAPPLRPAPALGADTSAILSDLGYTQSAIDDLKQRGIV